VREIEGERERELDSERIERQRVRKTGTRGERGSEKSEGV
jgi:hypothetical protein